MSEFITKHDKDNLKKYESGALRSDATGKGRFDLISPCMLKRLALVYERGCVKGERNWENGFPISRCIDSAFRHINNYREGDRVEDHLAAAIWNLSAAIHFEEMIKLGVLSPELDDLPRYGDDADRALTNLMVQAALSNIKKDSRKAEVQKMADDIGTGFTAYLKRPTGVAKKGKNGKTH